ncbi:hypothetical protein TorRG33x02_003120 [Trema orientale]|uniref:Uncharacterized protein n=1 Tax=Trema orientale TaxID=63057 RepID=A0A2P5G1S1_TREOI|nr:hypothetical protein TorRG33x02_003120 [Trema orientale]
MTILETLQATSNSLSDIDDPWDFRNLKTCSIDNFFAPSTTSELAPSTTSELTLLMTSKLTPSMISKFAPSMISLLCLFEFVSMSAKTPKLAVISTEFPWRSLKEAMSWLKTLPDQTFLTSELAPSTISKLASSMTFELNLSTTSELAHSATSELA